MPGENLSTVGDMLGEALGLLEWGPEKENDRQKIKHLVFKSQSLLSDEEMEIIRFGDVTRIADHDFEPYQTIKSIIPNLDDFEMPKFKVDEKTGERIEDEYGQPEIDCTEAIKILSEAYDLLEKVMEREDFPEVY